MSDSNSKQYILSIINCLTEESNLEKEAKDKEIKELKEKKIDIFSKDLFQNLYWNLLYFYSTKKEESKSKPEEQIFLSKVFVELLQIIYESNYEIFFEEDLVKSILIFVVYSYNKTTYMNLETILNIFLNLDDILEECESNKKIENEVSKFEEDIISTIKFLINKYSMDIEKTIKIDGENPNFNQIINCLKKGKTNVPSYLSGFIDYNKQFIHKKYILIKIYKYFEVINPHINNVSNFNLFQGYALNGLLTYEKSDTINFKNFYDVYEKRMSNKNAKCILKLSVELLGSKNLSEFKGKLQKIIFEKELEAPKINDIFDLTDDYYKDLYLKLKYFLFQYKTGQKICEIIAIDFSRVLWLNFCKLLLLNLNEDDIGENDIKIIFFLIVNLFSPDTDKNSLEYRDDAVSMLFSQCTISSEILTYQEIYKIIDKDYSDFYPDLTKDNKFTQIFIEEENEKLMEDSKKDKAVKNNLEIIYIKNLCKELPFHLLKKELKKSGKEKVTKTFESECLYNFYRNCYNDLDDYSKKSFVGIIKKVKSPSHQEGKIIKEIINDERFMDMIKDIMKSDVMNDAYKIIHRIYSTDGKYNYSKEMTEEEKQVIDSQTSASQNNLINGKSINYYYESFCKSMQNLLYSNRFIVMALPEEIKGFTFRFLKIIINSEGVSIESKKAINDDNDKYILLKAYLVFIVIHELNHFIKRQFNINNKIDVCKTPKIKGFDDEGEGGKQLIKLLFGDALINKYLNIEQAKYILDMKNWKKSSVLDFKNDFSKIATNKGNEGSIVYLYSEKMSICDHSKLFA